MNKFLQNIAVKWVLARLSERSSWVGIVAALSGLGIVLDPTYSALIIGLGTAIVGGIFMVTRDKKDVGDVVVKALQDLTPEILAAIQHALANKKK